MTGRVRQRFFRFYEILSGGGIIVWAKARAASLPQQHQLRSRERQLVGEPCPSFLPVSSRSEAERETEKSGHTRQREGEAEAATNEDTKESRPENPTSEPVFLNFALEPSSSGIPMRRSSRDRRPPPPSAAVPAPAERGSASGSSSVLRGSSHGTRGEGGGVDGSAPIGKRGGGGGSRASKNKGGRRSAGRGGVGGGGGSNADKGDSEISSSSEQDEEEEEEGRERAQQQPSSQTKHNGGGSLPRKRGRPSKAAIAADAAAASAATAAATSSAPQATPTRRSTGRQQAAAAAAPTTPYTTRKSTRSSSTGGAASNYTVVEPRRKAPKIPPPRLPTAPSLGAEIVARVSDAAIVKPARGGSGGVRPRGAGVSATEAGGLEELEPEFLEDLLVCWDFLHLMGVAETEVQCGNERCCCQLRLALPLVGYFVCERARRGATPISFLRSHARGRSLFLARAWARLVMEEEVATAAASAVVPMQCGCP